MPRANHKAPLSACEAFNEIWAAVPVILFDWQRVSGYRSPMKAAIVNPPLSKPCEPEPSVIALAGHLKARGISAEIFDANLAFHLNVLSPENLLAASALVEGPASTSAKRSAGGIGRVLAALRDPAVYQDKVRYQSALSSLVEAYRTAGRAMGVRLTPSDFVHDRLSPLKSDDLAGVYADPGLLPTVNALNGPVDEILSRRPGIIGISVSYLSQALHAWAMAGMFRQKGYEGFLVLGGGFVSSIAKNLSPASPALAPWDAAVSGPGERILGRMAETMKIPDLPGVMAPRAGIWNPGPAPVEGVSFAPELSTLPWADYLSPGGIMPVAASRGCYWAKCAFCPEAHGGASSFAMADAGKLSRALLSNREKGGPAALHLTDNAVPPSFMGKLAEKLEGANLPWYGFARLEKKFAEPGFMEKLARGGLKMLQLGIESSSPRLLNLMGKGTDPELADLILERARDSGVRVYGYFLFGMPTETEDEARATLEWIADRSDRLTFLNLSIMNLPKDGTLARSPENYGIMKLAPMDDINDLSLYLGHGGAETPGRARIRRILGEGRKEPGIRAALARTPKGFTSNHAAFAPIQRQ